MIFLIVFKSLALYVCVCVSQVALVIKNLPANAGDVRGAGSIPGLGRYPVEENGNSLQDACLENPIDRGTWWARSKGSQKVVHDRRNLASITHTHRHTSSYIYMNINLSFSTYIN